MSIPQCKSCNEEIKWIRTPAGKMTPVNMRQKTIWIFTADGWQTETGYESHFDTCSDPEKHRRKG